MSVPVSIILPTYNREDLLPQAVASVLAQTYPAWDLLIADDGSTDRTAQYLASLTDPRVRVLRLPHRGNPGAVRNAALPEARGAYLAYLDSDDWWEPAKLAMQVQALETHRECGWSYTLLAQADGEGRPLRTDDRVPYLPVAGWVLDALVAGDTTVMTSTVIARRPLLEEVGGFDESLVIGEDLELWIRLAARSPAVPVPRVLATRRQHPGNYVRRFRGSPAAADRMFDRVLTHLPTGRLRRALRRRRAAWYAKVALDEGHPGYLARALPEGLAQRGWWSALSRSLRRAVRLAHRD